MAKEKWRSVRNLTLSGGLWWLCCSTYMWAVTFTSFETIEFIFVCKGGTNELSGELITYVA